MELLAEGWTGEEARADLGKQVQGCFPVARTQMVARAVRNGEIEAVFRKEV